MCNELDWWENEKKILRLVGEAKEEDARLAVFPESGLSFSKDNTPSEVQIQESIDAIRAAAKYHDIFVLFCIQYVSIEDGGTQNDAILVDPHGKVVLKQYKIWCNKGNRPQLFFVDGVPCNVAICADRWAREACDLPVMMGSKVMIECSWASPPDYGKGRKSQDLVGPWWTPKPVRNGVFLIRTNRANIIEPDGTTHRCTEDMDDQILVRTLDLSKADRAEAIRRSSHPVFGPWWKMGASLIEDEELEVDDHPPLYSEDVDVRISVVQMAPVPGTADGIRMIREKLEAIDADLVVFPERVLWGEAIEGLAESKLEAGLTAVRDVVRGSRDATVVVGMPWIVSGKVRNSAFVIAPDGSVLTRYDQMSASPDGPYEPGSDPSAMWFQVNGVWSIVTVGRDHLWDEIAELAALRGAQVVVNLNHDRTDPERRDVFWQAFAMFRTTTVFANAVGPAANGGSVIYDTPVDTRITYPISLGRSQGEEAVLSEVRSPNDIVPWRERGPARFAAMGDWWRAGSRLIGPDSKISPRLQ